MLMSRSKRQTIEGAKSVVGSWRSIEDDRFSTETVTGGLTNRLTLVTLKDPESVSPSEVLVRNFGEGTDEYVSCRLLLVVSI